MTVFVEEYQGLGAAAHSERFQNVPQLPARQMTQVSSGGAVSTIALDAGTQFVALMNNAANAFYILAASSTGSTAAGSTGYIPQGQQILRGVKPFAKLFVWST